MPGPGLVWYWGAAWSGGLGVCFQGGCLLPGGVPASRGRGAWSEGSGLLQAVRVLLECILV